MTKSATEIRSSYEECFAVSVLHRIYGKGGEMESPNLIHRGSDQQIKADPGCAAVEVERVCAGKLGLMWSSASMDYYQMVHASVAVE